MYALVALVFLLDVGPARASTVLCGTEACGAGDTNATGILDLDVAGTPYNVTFVDDSAVNIYGPFPGTYDFPSDDAQGEAAEEAVNAVIAALATQPEIVTVGPSNSAIFNIGFGGISIPVQDVEQQFAQVAQGFYLDEWKITNNPDTTLYEMVASYADFSVVPEPSTALVFGLGLAGLAAVARGSRRKSDASA